MLLNYQMIMKTKMYVHKYTLIFILVNSIVYRFYKIHILFYSYIFVKAYCQTSILKSAER